MPKLIPEATYQSPSSSYRKKKRDKANQIKPPHPPRIPNDNKIPQEHHMRVSQAVAGFGACRCSMGKPLEQDQSRDSESFSKAW